MRNPASVAPTKKRGASAIVRGMDQNMILDHLAMVSRHVTRGEQIVARQREIIARLERAGCDTSYAKRLLLQFEEVQSLHVADRDRLEKALAEISKMTKPAPRRSDAVVLRIKNIGSRAGPGISPTISASSAALPFSWAVAVIGHANPE
jgi:hypothetical protein